MTITLDALQTILTANIANCFLCGRDDSLAGVHQFEPVKIYPNTPYAEYFSIPLCYECNGRYVHCKGCAELREHITSCLMPEPPHDEPETPGIPQISVVYRPVPFSLDGDYTMYLKVLDRQRSRVSMFRAWDEYTGYFTCDLCPNTARHVLKMAAHAFYYCTDCLELYRSSHSHGDTEDELCADPQLHNDLAGQVQIWMPRSQWPKDAVEY